MNHGVRIERQTRKDEDRSNHCHRRGFLKCPPFNGQLRYLRINGFVDFLQVRVAVGRANVDKANQVFHAFAQIDYLIRALRVQIDGHF